MLSGTNLPTPTYNLSNLFIKFHIE